MGYLLNWNMSRSAAAVSRTTALRSRLSYQGLRASGESGLRFTLFTVCSEETQSSMCSSFTALQIQQRAVLCPHGSSHRSLQSRLKLGQTLVSIPGRGGGTALRASVGPGGLSAGHRGRVAAG